MSDKDIVGSAIDRDTYDKRRAFRTEPTYVSLTAEADGNLPRLLVKAGDVRKSTSFNTVEELDERFEELLDEYDLEEE